ncbi:MAG: mechanosensitive ion channel domain-containing protein [Candidatus Bilamarchaeum sp.]
MMNVLAITIDEHILPFLSAGLIVLLGYIIGDLLKKAVIKLSEKTGIRQKVRFGIQKEAKKFGFDIDIIYITSLVLKYTVCLIGAFFALKMLPFDIGTSTLLLPIISYVPNILSAMLILIFGSALIELFADVVKYKLRDVFDEDADEAGVSNFSTAAASYVRYFLYIVILLTVFLQLGIKTENLMTLVLISGTIVLITVAILFVISAKDQAANISAGKYLKNNKILISGDVLELDQIKGEVEEVNLIMTTLKAGGKKYYIPNSKITSSVFSTQRK